MNTKKKSSVQGASAVGRASSKSAVHGGRPASHAASKSAVRSRKPVSRAAVHSRKARQRRKRRSFIPALILLLICLVALVVMAIVVFKPRTSSPTDAANEATPIPAITFLPQATPQPTEAPTAEPTPEPTATPQPTATPTAEPTATPTPFVYLPVVHKAEEASAKQIAITVDDCYQLENLKTIVSLAENRGAKLTLFPIGQNIVKLDLSDILKHCAFDLGFEIENHTWSHSRIFRLPEDEMAEEIWKQRAALNNALGVNYQQHFLRLMGGDGGTDQRIHNYLKQLGYLGIANWSVSGSDSDMNHIKSSLAPGQIYLFHTTDPDTKKLKEFIPWAISKGYKLVTMNELLGLPDNEITALTEQKMPEPEPFVDDHHTLGLEDYTWTVLQMQEVLRAQGYLVMDGPSTGYYGKQTAAAVSAYQQDHGLPVTGKADEQTQLAILSEG